MMPLTATTSAASYQDMKVVILAGGFGTRLAEETDVRPKPMVEIGGRPILWHIMMHYSQYGFKNFVICLGYKGHVIKKYFAEYNNLQNNMVVNLKNGLITQEPNQALDWNIELVETGPATETAGRLGRVKDRLDGKPFMLTYGDGVSNVNLHELIKFHREQQSMVTLTAVRPPARFGHLQFDGSHVTEFREKSQTDEGWINGGFFVIQPEFLEYITSDDQKLEQEPLSKIAHEQKLSAYLHPDFWQCMDTIRDKLMLEKLWETHKAPWKTWDHD